MKLGRKHAAIGIAAVILLAGIGWFAAGHYATRTARDEIDGFLIRNNLKSVISYGDISATPLGKATITDVSVKVGNIPIKCDTVTLSGVDTNHDTPRSANVTLSGINVPVLDLARTGVQPAIPLAKLGYQSMRGRLNLSYDLSNKGKLTVKTHGEDSQAGSWDMTLNLSGIEPDALATLAAIPMVLTGQSNEMNLWRRLETTAMNAKLADLELSLNDSGIHDRMQKLPDESIPASGNSSKANQGMALNETSLVKAGMAPSGAREIVTKISGWTEKGGDISLSTGLDRPIALMRPDGMRGGTQPAFDSLESFLVATKAKIH